MITAGQNAGGKGVDSVFLGQGDGTFEKLNSFETESLRSFAASLGDLNGDGVLYLVTAGNGGSGRATVFLGIGDGTFTKENSYATESTLSWGVALGDLNADGVLDMVTAGDSGLGEATIFFGAGDGTFAEVATITTETETSYALALGDLNGDGLLDIVTAGDSGSGQATVFLSNGDGTFKNSVTYDTESNFSASVTLGDLDGDGVLDVVTSGQLTGFPGQASIFLGESTDGVAPLLEFSLATQAQARQALPVFQRKLDQLSSQRAQIGAFQARISVAINTLQVEQESYLAARSQIVDADIAYESAMLLRNNILQQAGTTVLAQANQSPALALELLSRI
jgi:flagellin-like hook-associated protein FlgL